MNEKTNNEERVLSIDLDEIGTRAFAIAKAKNWYEFRVDGTVVPRDPYTMILLLLEELGEAVSALRDPEHSIDSIWYGPPPSLKPEGVAVELGDFVIRAADWLKSLAPPSRRLPTMTILHKYGWRELDRNSPVKALFYTIQDLNKVAAAACYARDYGFDLLSYKELEGVLLVAIQYIIYVCHFFNWPLVEAIALKQQFNDTRSSRHGNKRF